MQAYRLVLKTKNLRMVLFYLNDNTVFAYLGIYLKNNGFNIPFLMWLFSLKKRKSKLLIVYSYIICLFIKLKEADSLSRFT